MAVGAIILLYCDKLTREAGGRRQYLLHFLVLQLRIHRIIRSVRDAYQ